LNDFSERLTQQRLAWLHRPYIHTEVFEQAVVDDEIIAAGGAIVRDEDPLKKTEQVAKAFGWDSVCLDRFTQAVVRYRRDPTIENYLFIRRKFPDVEISVDQFEGTEELFSLDRTFKTQGIDTNLISAAMDGDEPSVDRLCLHLLELLATKRSLPKTGPQHIARRRMAVSEASVNYLVSMMLEVYSTPREPFRIPGSLVVLARQQLISVRTDLHAEYRSRVRLEKVALQAGKNLKPGETLSIDKLHALTGVPRSTAARYLANGEFKLMVEHVRQSVAGNASTGDKPRDFTEPSRQK
jgi:hypothetical protein